MSEPSNGLACLSHCSFIALYSHTYQKLYKVSKRDSFNFSVILASIVIKFKCYPSNSILRDSQKYWYVSLINAKVYLTCLHPAKAERLHLYLQPLRIICITSWAPPPVRLAAALDSHRSSNPTVNWPCKGSRLRAPYENLRLDGLRWSWGGDASAGEWLKHRLSLAGRFGCTETIINQSLADSYQNPISERQVTIEQHTSDVNGSHHAQMGSSSCRKNKLRAPTDSAVW